MLAPGEKIVLDVSKSKTRLVLSWVWGILGCWLLLIPLIRAIVFTVDFCHTEYIISDHHVYEKRGWLNTQCDEMTLDHVENVTSSQTFWGKIFRYGDACIRGTNRNHINFFAVTDPNEVRRTLNGLTARD